MPPSVIQPPCFLQILDLDLLKETRREYCSDQDIHYGELKKKVSIYVCTLYMHAEIVFFVLYFMYKSETQKGLEHW